MFVPSQASFKSGGIQLWGSPCDYNCEGHNRSVQQTADVFQSAAQAVAKTGNQNNRALSEFQNVLQSHINAPGTRVIIGSYRNNPAIHYFDPRSGLNVISDSSGKFLSG